MAYQYFNFKKSRSFLAVMPFSLLATLSCEKYSALSISERQLPEPAAVLADENGAITGEIDPNKSTYLQASGESAVSQNSISFPPGALAIPTQVTLQEGSSLVANDLSEQLGIADNEFSAASPATVISSAQNIDAQNPFSINLAIGTNLRLNTSDENLIVIYKVQVHAEGGVFKVGILPRSYLKIENGFAQFATTYFGSYQLAYAKNSIEEKAEKATETPIISKNEEKALPEFGFKNIILTYDSVTRSALISAELKNIDVTLNSCVAFLDRDKSSPWDYKISVTKVTGISEVISNENAHSLYAQLVCQSKDGRSAVSLWSEKLDVPKKAAAPVTVEPEPEPEPEPELNVTLTMTGAPNQMCNTATCSTVTFSGTCSLAGSTIKLMANASELGSTVCQTTNIWTLNNSTFNDLVSGNYILSATIHSNSISNSSENINFAIDKTAPTLTVSSPNSGNYCNAMTCSAVVVSGTCSENGQNVEISGIITATTTCSSGLWNTSVNLESLTEGNITINIDHSDLAGNLAEQKSVIILKDTIAPAVNVGNDVTANVIYPINATSSDANGIASYNWTKQSGTGLVTFSAQNSEDTEVSADSNDSYILRLTATDNAGNTGYDELSFSWDTSGPIVSILTPIDASYCNANSCNSVTVSGLCSEDGRNVIIGGAISDSAVCTSGTWTQVINYTSMIDGNLSITANHDDSLGNNATEAAVSITKDTVPPTVLLATANILSNAQVNIDATTSDNVGIDNYSWTNVSGPGGVVTFGPAAEDTTVEADTDGIYTLRLTVTDLADNSAYDEMQLIWDETAPIVNVGADITTNELVLLSASSTDANGIASYIWSNQSGSITFNPSNTIDTEVSADTDDSYVLVLTVTDNAGNSASDELIFTWDETIPNLSINSPTYNACNISNCNSFPISGTCSENGRDVIITGSDTSTAICSGGVWSTNLDLSVHADGVSNIILNANHSDLAGNDAIPQSITIGKDTVVPIVNANIDLISKVQVNINNAAASDNNGITSYAWTQQSGPGTITFGSATNLTTTVSANADGVYTLRLTATDYAGNTAYDDMVLTWDTTPPTVNLGPPVLANQSYPMNSAIVNDENGIASYSWTKYTGPGTVTFTPNSSINTNIIANAQGVYELKLIAVDDAGNSGFGYLNFTWDNIAPNFLNPPTAFKGRKIGETILNLSFDSAENYALLKIYRGNTPNTTPSISQNCISDGVPVSEITNSFISGQFPVDGLLPDQEYNYVFCLKDIAGNESHHYLYNAQTGSHVVFVTIEVFDGNFLTLDPPENETQHKTGLAGADHQCQTIGSTLPEFSGSYWKAILSDSFTSARSRLDIKNSVYNYNMAQVKDVATNNEMDFWNALTLSADKFNYQQNYLPIETFTHVWTGTMSLGASDNNHCINWTNETGAYGRTGNPYDSSVQWIEYSSPIICSNFARLYCISQELPGLDDFHGESHPDLTGKTKISFKLPYAYKNKNLIIEMRRGSATAITPPDTCDSGPIIGSLNSSEINGELVTPGASTLISIDDDLTAFINDPFNYRVCVFEDSNDNGTAEPGTDRLITTSHFNEVYPKNP